jgi:prepilin-type N-terminal cleavage/methylation domain-containing protein
LNKNNLGFGFDSPGRLCGFTLLEILAVITILGILSTLIFTATRISIERAEKPACMANLKNLHMALATYLTENGHWPQVPDGITLDSDEENAWWRATLAPHGMVEKSWSCPTLKRTAREKNMEHALKENHYVPSLFDEFPATPYRWPKMAWAMEVGNNHGTGLLLVMMDGSVQTYEEFHLDALK